MIQAQAPGRICLFGEHQDYLGHPVIAGAVDLYFRIQGKARGDRKFVVHKRDLGETEEIHYPAEGMVPYRRKRDYFRSGLNALRRAGVAIEHGADVEIWSAVPIGAGCGSSSVMLVAWLRFLGRMFGWEGGRDPVLVAETAFAAEVAEFGEPGGKMDHYTSSLGGMQFLDFASGTHVRLRARMPGFVLVDSLEKKDTLGGLKRIKEGQAEALRQIRKRYPGAKLLELEAMDLNFLPEAIRPFGIAALVNYCLTWKGKKLLEAPGLTDGAEFGRMLSEHQRTFRDCFRNTTPKIERMLETALEAGALGGKMNGSGGGGTMFVYAPGKEEAVMEKLQPFKVKIHKVAIV